MRLLHTSDWHLGRSLHGVDLLEHQAAFGDHLVDLVRAEDVDAVVVAGDVYDRAIPPVEAVQLLSDLLARLCERTTVIITAGNHDSATRLGFAGPLLREQVRLRTTVAQISTPVDLGPVVVYGLPYLDPDTVRVELADGGPLPERSHEAVVAAAMRRVRADLATRPGVRSVVAAHAFVVGGLPSESERDIRVGGVDQVPSDVFVGVDYVALGHLHTPQDVDGPPGTVLRYCGSPLAYSFAEAGWTKSSVLLDLDEHQLARTLVPTPVPRRLSEIHGTLDEVLGAAGEPYRADWVKVRVTDPVRPLDLFRRVRERFPHVLAVQHEPTAGSVPVIPTIRDVPQGRDPVQVAVDFVGHVTGTPPTDAEAGVLRRAYEDVLTADRSV